MDLTPWECHRGHWHVIRIELIFFHNLQHVFWMLIIKQVSWLCEPQKLILWPIFGIQTKNKRFYGIQINSNQRLKKMSHKIKTIQVNRFQHDSIACKLCRFNYLKMCEYWTARRRRWQKIKTIKSESPNWFIWTNWFSQTSKIFQIKLNGTSDRNWNAARS